jgi:hypothetical protein
VGSVFGYPRPVLREGASYPGIWLESGPQEGLLYSAFNAAAAANNHRIFFDLQRADGWLPYGVRVNRAGWSQIQMVVPIAATALELAERTQDQELLARAYRACGDWDAWLRRYRNTRGTGLCEAFCGYDTGEDNSARFRGLPWRCPQDDARICPAAGGLPYLAPDLSATVYGGRVALARMAKLLGKQQEAARWEEQAAALRQAIMKWCFDPDDACFYDRDTHNNLVRIRCVELLVVLGEHVADQRWFAEIYRRHIRNPQRFWAPYPFPSVALDDPAFDHTASGNSWGGPSQALTALRAPRWMEFYGKSANLTDLMTRWIEALTASSGFGQQMDPQSGLFAAGSAYSPAMLVVVDFVARLYGVTREGETLHWNCRLPAGASESHYSLPTAQGSAELVVRSGGSAPLAELTLAGKKRLTVAGAVRVNTNAAGEPAGLLGTESAPSSVTLTWPSGRVLRREVKPDEIVALPPGLPVRG